MCCNERKERRERERETETYCCRDDWRKIERAKTHREMSEICTGNYRERVNNERGIRE